MERFSTRKTGPLLAYLACHSSRQHRREELIDLLWPDQETHSAQNSLRVALTTLRRMLQPVHPSTPPLLLVDSYYIGLNQCSIDVDAFTTAIQDAKRADHSETQISHLQAAIALYHGPLLSDLDDTWILPERQRLTDAYLWALDRLATDAARARDYDQALDYAHRAIYADPLRETSHRNVMRLYVALGRPRAALQQYHELQRLLTELDATPSPATRAVVEQLLTQQQASGAVHAVVTSQPASPAASIPAASTPATSMPHDPSKPSPPTPPASSAPLPPHFTRMFGREEEITQIGRLLIEAATAGEGGCSPIDSRLVTLTGPGGSGKTRLALETARSVEGAFQKAVWWVPLADLADARRLPDALALAFGLKCSDTDDLLQQVVSRLGGRPALLILDNFEHLLEKGASLVQQLRTVAPTLALLITSRQRLRLPGERTFSVLPLPVPMRAGTPEQLLEFSSVQILVDRARAVRPEFRMTAANAASVAELCRRLEGMPLAIELAAAWAQTLTPAAMLKRLEQSSDLLVSQEREIPARHRTMYGALEWSYGLLPSHLQHFFVSLAVFRGGWSVAAAAEIGEAPLAAEYLSALQDRSLVYCAESNEEELRFRMLEVVREFATRQLSPEEQKTYRQRHADYFCRFVETAQRQFAGPDRAAALDGLEKEMDNLRAALDWSGAQEGGEAMELRMAATLQIFWMIRGYLTEGREYLEAALARQRNAPPTLELARAFAGAGRIAMLQSDNAAAEALIAECLEMRRALGDQSGVAAALRDQGVLATRLGDRGRAERLYQEALAIRRALGDMAEGQLLLNLGELTMGRNEFATARAYFEESLEIGHKTQNLHDIAGALALLGELAAYEARPQAALILFKEALAIVHRLGDKLGIAQILVAYAELMTDLDNHLAAGRSYADALPLARDLGYRLYIARSFDGLAFGALAAGNPAHAGRLLGAADRLFQVAGAPLPPNQAAKRERRIAAARAADADGVFASSWTVGQAMDLERAISLALAGVAATANASKRDADDFGRDELRGRGDDAV